MPIRFRCQHCSQLMGIARRKAGTTVACTRCAQQVLVPATDQVELPVRPRVPPVPANPNPVPGGSGERAAHRDVPLFDRPDFDEQLEENDAPASMPFEGEGLSILGARVPPPVPDPGAPGGPVEYDVERVDPTKLAPAGGFVLTSLQATLLTLTAILMMVLAFGAGLLVGKYYL
jgi:hypothetical protein